MTLLLSICSYLSRSFFEHMPNIKLDVCPRHEAVDFFFSAIATFLNQPA